MQVCVPSTPGADVPHAAPADAAALPQAADRHDAEEPAAPQAVGVAAGGPDAAARSATSSTRSTTSSRPRSRASCSARARSISTCSTRAARDALHNVAIVRVEQLYPFPAEEYAADHRASIANAREIVWCQEEPQNQGAWYQIRHRLQESLSKEHQLLYAGRAPAAAPATGIAQMHAANSSRAWSTQRCAPPAPKNRCARPRGCSAPASSCSATAPQANHRIS